MQIGRWRRAGQAQGDTGVSGESALPPSPRSTRLAGLRH